MRARASGRFSRTLAITAIIVFLLAGAAWWFRGQATAPPEGVAAPEGANVRAATPANDPQVAPSATSAAADNKADSHADAPRAHTETAPSAQHPPNPQQPAATAAIDDRGPASAFSWTTAAESDDADEEEERRLPRDWHLCAPGATASEHSYRFASDSKSASSGAYSASITSLGPSPSPVGAAWCQLIAAEAFRGKRVAYSAWLRTLKAAPGARLTIRVDGIDGRVLASSLSFRELVPGTTPWARQTIVIDIPKDAAAILVGAVLIYKGTLWMDDATLEIVDESWPLTQDIRSTGTFMQSPRGLRLSPHLLNPGFEETVPLK